LCPTIKNTGQFAVKSCLQVIGLHFFSDGKSAVGKSFSVAGLLLRLDGEQNVTGEALRRENVMEKG